MIPTKNFRRTALSLTLLSIVLGVTLISATTTENNYKTDNNFLTNISESTHTESGYKTNIIINPNVAGIYISENGYKLDLTINQQGIGGSHKENNYKLDLIPEKTFPDTPDVAVTKITTSKTVVGQGYTTQINATVSNQALNYETLHLTIITLPDGKNHTTTTLPSGNSTTLTLTWNTTGVAKGNYTITAEAIPVSGETDTLDNTCVDGAVMVTIPGDVDGSRKVDWKDIYTGMIIRFNAKIGDPGYVPNSDVTCDGVIDWKDIYQAIIHFNESW